MFEKIFGIFRKRKKADVSQQIPGETGEDAFGVGDTGMEEDFDAETISLETGMSDGGFASSSGAGESAPGTGVSAGIAEPTTDQDSGLGLEPPETAEEEEPLGGPISPPPEVEAVPRLKRKRGKGRIKAALTTVLVVIIGLAIGFFAVRPAMHIVKKLLTAGPTPEEQLAKIQAEDAQLDKQLTDYHSVGTIEQIMEVKNELDKRSEMADQMKAIEVKVANTPAVEKNIDELSTRLENVNRELEVQKGSLANVQKAVKQLGARKDYLASATTKNLEQIAINQKKSNTLKAHMNPESIRKAEAASTMHHDVYKSLGQTTSNALSPSS